MTYRLRVIGGVGILLAIGGSHFGSVWVSVIGGVLCFAFLLGCVRGLLTS